MLGTTGKIFFAAMRERADLYVIHDPELIPTAWLLSKLGKAVVYDMHENTPKQLLTKEWIPRQLRQATATMLATIQRVLLPSIPVVFAESSYVDDYRYVKQSVIVLNMPHRGSCVDKQTRPTLGYIGGVSRLRGATATLEAMSILASRGLSPDFECIGPVADADKKEVLQLAADLPGSVRLPGYVRSDAGWQRIARCHVGLAVLKNVPNYYESFPGKMFEYLSFGIPVVVSDFPIYREVVERIGCGFCVDPDSPEEIADAIEWLLTHPCAANAMGSRGKAAIDSTYNWQVEYEKLLDFYETALSGRKARIVRDHKILDSVAA